MKKQWVAIFLCMSLLATGLLRLTGCAAKTEPAQTEPAQTETAPAEGHHAGEDFRKGGG